MIRFECDYAEGAHPAILARLSETNMEQTPGYGQDEYCEQARQTLRTLCRAPEAEVQFFVGGTQANFTIITAALRPHQGVLCAETGHIGVHETGAVEAGGHKVLPLASADGKITAAQIEAHVRAHFADCNHEHIVQPGMVYLSHPTENGTLYTADEIRAIGGVCRENGLLLFVDGARLVYGLAAAPEVSLPLLAEQTDVFYLGGTKAGALFGEAAVITNKALARDFRYILKQRGGMLAKGRLLGLQFGTLLQDDLYLALGRHAVELALRVRRALEQKGIALRYDSVTNQQFPIFADAQYAALSRSYAFSFWDKPDDTHTCARICTSWATRAQDVDALVRDINSL